MSVTTPEALFEHELKDVYYAEQQLVKALEQLASESTRPELRQAFQNHLQETENHVRRLEQVFQVIGRPPEAQICQGIEGIIKEKKSFAKENPSPEILDMFNLGAAARAEHYEIAAYTGLIMLAQQLGLTQAVAPLQQNLREEEAALQKVTSLAQQGTGAAPTGPGAAMSSTTHS